MPWTWTPRAVEAGWERQTGSPAATLAYTPGWAASGRSRASEPWTWTPRPPRAVEAGRAGQTGSPAASLAYTPGWGGLAEEPRLRAVDVDATPG